jgi:hypothetical protein
MFNDEAFRAPPVSSTVCLVCPAGAAAHADGLPLCAEHRRELAATCTARHALDLSAIDGDPVYIRECESAIEALALLDADWAAEDGGPLPTTLAWAEGDALVPLPAHDPLPVVDHDAALTRAGVVLFANAAAAVVATPTTYATVRPAAKAGAR